MCVPGQQENGEVYCPCVHGPKLLCQKKHIENWIHDVGVDQVASCISYSFLCISLYYTLLFMDLHPLICCLDPYYLLLMRNQRWFLNGQVAEKLGQIASSAHLVEKLTVKLLPFPSKLYGLIRRNFTHIRRRIHPDWE